MSEVRIEGQVFELPDDVASDDTKLRATLVAVTPLAATAEIVRSKEGEKSVVTLLKKAGTKGGDWLSDALRRAPTRLDPLFRLIEATSPGALASGEVTVRSDEIRAVLGAANEQRDRLLEAARRIADAPHVASARLPEGF